MADPTDSTATPRSVSLLLARALRHVGSIQPPPLRAPITAMLEAGIEECVITSSLLGHRINHLIELARRLVETAEKAPVDD